VCPKRFGRCGAPAPFWPFHCASRLVSRELREEPRSRPCAALGSPLACLHRSILFEPGGGGWAASGTAAARALGQPPPTVIARKIAWIFSRTFSSRSMMAVL
jgi:hypothetical protein